MKNYQEIIQEIIQEKIEENIRLGAEIIEILNNNAIEVPVDTAAGRTNSFMTATGKLIKCVEALSTSEKMRKHLKELIYDVIVAAEDGAFVAGTEIGRMYPESEYIDLSALKGGKRK